MGTRTRRSSTSSGRSTVIGLTLVATGGLVVGTATSYLQGVLPRASNTLANSGAVWSVLAFALVAIAMDAAREPAMAIAGVVALLAEVAGYYSIASPLRGFPSTSSERIVWTAAALVVGPFVGLAAAWWTGGTELQRLAAAAAMSGIVLGEGMHGLIRIDRHGSQWWVEIVLGLGVGAAVSNHRGRTAGERLAAVASVFLAAGVVFVAYGSTLMLSGF